MAEKESSVDKYDTIIKINNFMIYRARVAFYLFFVLGAICILSITSYFLLLNSPLDKQNNVFSLTEVSQHNSSDDCWIIIDDIVFNVTEPSKEHPSMFNCGGDSTENYHKNHGPEIRSQMMPFKIGLLNDSSVLELVNRRNDQKPAPIEFTEINPYTEFLLQENTWNAKDLMIVMERDNQSLLFIDGITHVAVARVHNIGYQPHTLSFSPDGRYAYHISRDGWLTKINIENLEVVDYKRVGVSSRGTGLTESGKYLVIGNYDPQNVVIIDTDTLETLKVIELFNDRDGETVKSRAGAVVEVGEKVLIALKDMQSVWVIDTSIDNFPVTNYFWNIGEKGDTLHDAYLTPDGRYFIAAVQGSDFAWVLDTQTMTEIARVPTGKTPHTGPGATWKDYTFIPSLGEGGITAINIKNWNQASIIKTSGPGLFVRSYNDNYPYILADAALSSEGDDEIYVIDGKTLNIVETLIPMKGKKSVHPEFTLDGKYVYVGVWGGGKVYVYDSMTFEVIAAIDSVSPTGIFNVGLRIDEPGL